MTWIQLIAACNTFHALGHDIIRAVQETTSLKFRQTPGISKILLLRVQFSQQSNNCVVFSCSETLPNHVHAPSTVLGNALAGSNCIQLVMRKIQQEEREELNLEK